MPAKKKDAGFSTVMRLAKFASKHKKGATVKTNKKDARQGGGSMAPTVSSREARVGW